MATKAPNVSGLPSPKTPPSVRHASYPTDTPRLTLTKGASTRDYGKKPPKAPPVPSDLNGPFGGF